MSIYWNTTIKYFSTDWAYMYMYIHELDLSKSSTVEDAIGHVVCKTLEWISTD